MNLYFTCPKGQVVIKNYVTSCLKHLICSGIVKTIPPRQLGTNLHIHSKNTRFKRDLDRVNWGHTQFRVNNRDLLSDIRFAMSKIPP